MTTTDQLSKSQEHSFLSRQNYGFRTEGTNEQNTHRNTKSRDRRVAWDPTVLHRSTCDGGVRRQNVSVDLKELQQQTLDCSLLPNNSHLDIIIISATAQAQSISLHLTIKPSFHYPSWRPKLTGDQFPLPVNMGRVDGRAFPLVELTGRGNAFRILSL